MQASAYTMHQQDKCVAPFRPKRGVGGPEAQCRSKRGSLSLGMTRVAMLAIL